MHLQPVVAAAVADGEGAAAAELDGAYDDAQDHLYHLTLVLSCWDD